ncbi:MAG: magnesium chelatase ATPase subunit D [Rhodobacteraceae bacterium]|nr:magnesium chelatase ATPase subunit D [Paracoccaceae bacterium]MAY46084.1 magnesium chelatase ATPase subunit D [Paracoccaceae bacterium]
MNADPWARTLAALAALAVEPGLKGICVRVRAGPVRTALDHVLTALPGPTRRIHPGLSDAELFGGIDVTASLATGHRVRSGGLASKPAILLLPMAERVPPGLAGRLAQLLDSGGGHRLILLDEGVDAEETAPCCLRERLAFATDLTALRHTETTGGLPAPFELDAARTRLTRVTAQADTAATLAGLALRFGIDSLRAPLLALRTARALAALEGRDVLAAKHLRTAAELVYAPRATRLPEGPAAPEPPDTAEDILRDGTTDLPGEIADQIPSEIPTEILVEAVRACLPPDLLGDLLGDLHRRAPGPATGNGAGARRKGNRRGRPLPARPGRPDGRARIDLLATLRAAAPWQTLRRRARPGGLGLGLRIHPADIRLKRYENRSDRLLVFLVDTSGSTALSRLAEAKGAVEMLLGQAYASRDHVALIAMRGTGADLILPPTRSLVQARRRLTALPGGGGTPLASGLCESQKVARSARQQGFAPVLVLLTDGKANIALDGTANRRAAAADMNRLARAILAEDLPGLLIDISPRPGPDAVTLARTLGARHLPLPHADATRISRAVSSALGG